MRYISTVFLAERSEGIRLVVTNCRADRALGRTPLLVLDLAEFAATSPANGSLQADHPTTADARIICGKVRAVSWVLSDVRRDV
ncbi:hypothetical protein [Micromonospora sp. NPDC050200]|uniref:hypothetical protein n=1 Tax=Micromonospora sp. NPDC050200 TaxID=3155664 RepID=UPI003408771F